MTIPEFIAKWRKVELKERSASQEHFLDLCRLFDHPSPATADPTGEKFCFEKGASKHGGGEGFADVWKRGFFGWEYKGKHKDLDAAYDQLLRYRNALENPPLLVVCDLDRIIVHTNFTGTVSVVHEIALESLSDSRNIEIMRAVFHNPEALRPGRTSVAVTQEAAKHFAEIAAAMRQRGLDSASVAHFLDRIVFCLFAEDIELLPENVFTRIVEKSNGVPIRFGKMLSQLFDTMAVGGDFGIESIHRFNGNLFEDRTIIEITSDELKRISVAAALDWSSIDPSIFGTLFERGLDPAKRAQLGAHFTSREDIELVIDAVIMSLLRREWAECHQKIESLLIGEKSATAQKKIQAEAESLLHGFLDRLQKVRVLDPACGSGNFLYIALLKLKDLEKEVILFGVENGLGSFLPMVGPSQLFGIEINSYAHDLAQMTIWIGWLQWIRVNGFGFPADPILQPLSENIRLMDAILSEDGEPEWPTVDFIVGNPPFLGDKLMRGQLGDEYVTKLRDHYKNRVPGGADLCCYWFEKGRTHIANGWCKRAGLLATQGIRGGLNREVLKRIKESGNIFWAESDRPWILNGANVHVSMVGFDDGDESVRTLDGKTAIAINANLTATSDIGSGKTIHSNTGISYLGNCKGGPFDIGDSEAIDLLLSSGNPNLHPNSDVLRPILNSEDLLKLHGFRWIIDSADLTEESFAGYERPFSIVVKRVKPLRDQNRDNWLRSNWWRPQRMRPEMRFAVKGISRFLITPTTAKHRIFEWLSSHSLPDHQLIVFARSDDLFFGVLHSRFHEVWSLRMGTRLETRPRYTPTTCFETFPFPEGVLHPTDPLPPHLEAIAAIAKELNQLRENWLNPPEWTKTQVLEFPGTVGGPWDRYIDRSTIEDRGSFQIGTVRYPRIVPRDSECEKRLKDRTLTKLYNQRPAWLAACHARLDAAVAVAYGWPADLSDEEIIERLLALNLELAAR